MKFCFRALSSFLAIFLVSCNSQEDKSLADRMEYLDRQIETYTERVEKAQKKAESLKEELNEATEKAAPALKSEETKEAMLAQMRESIEKLAELEGKVESSAYLLDLYRKSFKPRSLPDGTNLGDVTLVDGTIYKNVVIKRSASDQLNIGHSGGFALVPIANLPQNLREQFLLAPSDSSESVDPAKILMQKPRFLKSDTEHAKEFARESAGIEAERTAERAKLDAEREAQRLQRLEREKQEDEEARLRKEKMETYRQQYSALRQKIESLSSSLRAEQESHYAMSFQARNGGIKLSQTDLQRKLAPIEQKIKAIEAQLAEARSQLSGLTPP